MEHRNTQSPDIPKWSALLVEAVNKPGLIMKAYSAFYNYSLGNQLLALVQCQMRGLQPGPINTFPRWQDLGRHVMRGARALTLCMPITRKRRNEESGDDESNGEGTFTSFVYKARWFVLNQTEGEDLQPQVIPGGHEASINGSQSIRFHSTARMVPRICLQAARSRSTRWRSFRTKTLFHELAHVVIGHTAEADFADTEKTPRSLREVEAEAVALLCCESLELEGADYCRGYLQNWLYQGVGFDASAIPEKCAQKIFRAADQILRVGRPRKQPAEENAN
jgi:hypothetical protein